MDGNNVPEGEGQPSFQDFGLSLRLSHLSKKNRVTEQSAPAPSTNSPPPPGHRFFLSFRPVKKRVVVAVTQTCGRGRKKKGRRYVGRRCVVVESMVASDGR